MFPKKRIMLLPVSAGTGHLVAAKAIETALHQRYSDVETKNIDVLESAPLLRGVYKHWYDYLAKHMPEVYGYIYKSAEEKGLLENTIKLPGIIFQEANAKSLLKDIQAFRPDVIVSLHPLTESLVGFWLRRGKIATYHVVITTDFAGHRFWAQENVDQFFVSNDEVAHYLRTYGVAKETISVTGIPVDLKFYEHYNQKRIRKDMNINHRKPMVLYYGLGFNHDVAVRILEALVTDHEHDYTVVALAGKSPQYHESFSDIAYRHPNIKVVGYTNEMHRYMAAADVMVSKAGGLASTEAIHLRLPFIIFQPIPGQEQYNATYLLEKGAAMFAPSVEMIPFKVMEFLSSWDLRRNMRQSLEGLDKGQAAFTVAAALYKNASLDE